MRIGIDASLATLRGTGTGRYAAELLSQLVTLDQRNEYVLYLDGHDASDNPLAHLRAPHVRLRVTEAPFTLARVHLNLPACLRRDRIDVYHSLGFFLPWLWFGKAIVTIHDIHPVLYPEYWWSAGTRISYLALRTHIPLALQRASRILTPSEYTRRTISRRFGIPAAKIVVTPEAANPFFFATPPKEDLEAVERRFGSEEFFLYVGALSPLKNVAGLVQAFARVRQRFAGRPLRLVIVGQPTGRYWERRLHPLIQRLGLTDAILVERFVDEATLRALYRSAVALILPSFAEGFGLPVVEAMACGAAVVTSRTGALPEVTGEAALSVDPHDLDDLARAMEQILTEPELRRSLGAGGRRQAESFSWERTARQTLDVYGQV